MIRSLIDYSRFFAHALLNAEERALLLAHRARPIIAPDTDRIEALRAAVGWLMRTQDRGTDRGSASYHLVQGWSASYPETTGYIIPTLIAAGRYMDRQDPIDHAVRAAEWLLAIQRDDGGWQGGRVGEDRPSIVFNTAQVVRGMLAAHAVTGREEFRGAAVRAADWIVSVQEVDGSWRTRNFLGAARVYDTYVDAPLLQLHALTGDERYERSARRHLEWVLAQQCPNGWFANCDNTIEHNDRPITHAIAYTIDGLIASGTALNNEDLVHAGRKAADALLDSFLKSGWLSGRYDRDWNGSEAMITTGCAQLAIAWSRLHSITGEARYAEGLQRMCSLLVAVQRKSTVGPADIHGALPGSYPLWGRYEKFAFPNWATKYFTDALLCAEGKPPLY